MTTPFFHPFPHLPYELRAQIWSLAAAEPRTVELRLRYKKKYPALTQAPPHNKPYTDYCYSKYSAVVPYLITGLTPVPAIMHTCRESRTIGQKFYGGAACAEIIGAEVEVMKQRQLFEDAKIQRNKAKRLIRQEKEERERRAAAGELTVEEEGEARLVELYGELEEYKPEERHVYINWEIDTLSLGGPGGGSLHILKPVAHLVQKFKYARRYSDEWYVRGEISELRMFRNLKELHIVALDGFQQWRWASEEDWPCEIENVFLYEDNSRMSLVELDEMFEEQDKEYYRQQEEEEEEARRREEAQQSGDNDATNV
ncbi:hypothetical protein QBC40DRAFT_329851 [Triangularia verruculosa]|uniref:2EXR domain-containing protein n=1 Tax=Triangularia verruculosa TaxID=2587418 RepID=A0AAN6XE93_9PEZI|nr:hypothetical protein QBC40DRAFT_329851 [Triangularia verruculosa]